MIDRSARAPVLLALALRAISRIAPSVYSNFAVSGWGVPVADDRSLSASTGLSSLHPSSQDRLAEPVELLVPFSALLLPDRPLVAAFGVPFLTVRQTPGSSAT